MILEKIIPVVKGCLDFDRIVGTRIGKVKRLKKSVGLRQKSALQYQSAREDGENGVVCLDRNSNEEILERLSFELLDETSGYNLKN